MPNLTTLVVAYLPGIFLSYVLRRFLWVWLYSLLRFPGTFAHEVFCHWLVGTVLGARPIKLQLVPQRQLDGSYILGQVCFSRLTWFNSFFVGMAPLLLFLPLYWLTPSNLSGPIEQFAKCWLYLALFFISAIPSAADLRIAFQPGAIVFIGVLVFLYYGVLNLL
jgi:hypothetical protein